MRRVVDYMNYKLQTANSNYAQYIKASVYV